MANISSGSRCRGTVLLVDDDVLSLRALSTVLRSEQFTVSTAVSGEQAMERMERGGVDVVVTDMAIPGMSGVDLIRTLHEREPDVPVVLLTGDGDGQSATLATECGALTCFVKPIDLHLLEEVLEHAIRIHQAGRKAS